MKKYDEKYFRRWYHDPSSRIISAADVERRVTMTAAVAEFLLDRPLRSVLDVGCGEAPWQPILTRERPRLQYTGVDSSEYAVKKYGRKRNIVLGDFGTLDDALPATSYDLVVSSDVMHYLGKADLENGIEAIAGRVGGIAYLAFFTSRDGVVGDKHGMKLRPPAYYLGLFRENGLFPLGMQFYGGEEMLDSLAWMERTASP
jgi:SAM-dependent methyltransferase